MIELQVLSRVLNSRNIGLLELNGINEDYFQQYKPEYLFITNHVEQYGKVPDKETFLSKFQDFDIIEVTENDKYLIDTLNEEHLYSISVPIINKVAELMQTNSNEAVSYLQSNLVKLSGRQSITGIDIISQADLRLREWQELKEHKEDYLLETGFKELDQVIGGFHSGEELVVFFARTGQGKSWVLLKSLEHAWKMNRRVGLIEPEMSANKTGYRFDTITHHASNSALMRGDVVEDYDEYIKNLSASSTPFFVAHPKDFSRKITVSKLKAFVLSNKLDILAIDGISYLTDERKERGDSRTTQLTNISEDLMDLSIELKIPVIVVCQSNREGAKEDELQLENIRDSDGIAYNASIVLSVTQKDPGLILNLLKNRNGRNAYLTYLWDIDVGNFEYIPSGEESGIDDTQKSQEIRRSYRDRGDVF